MLLGTSAISLHTTAYLFFWETLLLLICTKDVVYNSFIYIVLEYFYKYDNIIIIKCWYKCVNRYQILSLMSFLFWVGQINAYWLANLSKRWCTWFTSLLSIFFENLNVFWIANLICFFQHDLEEKCILHPETMASSLVPCLNILLSILADLANN